MSTEQSQNTEKTEKELSSMETLHESSRFCIFVSQLVGYFPVSEHQNHKFRWSTPLIISVVIIILSVVSGFYCMFTNMNDDYDLQKESETFRLVIVGWTFIMFACPTISRLSLINCQKKLANLMSDCATTTELATKLDGSVEDLSQFCHNLRKRYKTLTVFYSVSGFLMWAISIPAMLKFLKTPSLSSLAQDLPIIFLSTLCQLSFFSFFVLDYFCQIYNHCLDCLINKVRLCQFNSIRVPAVFAKVETSGRCQTQLTNADSFEEILRCFSALEIQVEKCNETFKLKMTIEVFHYIATCVFYGYFAIHFILSKVTFLLIATQIAPLIVQGYGVFAIARLSTKLSEKTILFFKELAQLASHQNPLTSNTKLKVGRKDQ